MPPTQPVVEASATFELAAAPEVSRLYFWALQVTFAEGAARLGGAHLGLQWNPRFPDNRAVNWGGYDERGRVLAGTVSPLPSTPDDPNTRDYRWEPGRPYRLHVMAGDEGWRGEITDLSARRTTLVRDLPAGGSQLTALMVWSEVFADCDHPSVTARWSDFGAWTADGEIVKPAGVRVNYQAYEQGGCSNTTVRRDGGAFLQITNAERTVPQGTELALRSD